jgi:hypothetical protein
MIALDLAYVTISDFCGSKCSTEDSQLLKDTQLNLYNAINNKEGYIVRKNIITQVCFHSIK